jgi:hypothetical protein
LKLLTNFEILPVTRFKEPEAAILTLKKCLQEAVCDSVKSNGSRLRQVNSVAFSLQPMRGWH